MPTDKTTIDLKTPWVVEKGRDESDYDVIRDNKDYAIFGSAQYYPWVEESFFPAIVQAVNERDALLAKAELFGEMLEAVKIVIPLILLANYPSEKEPKIVKHLKDLIRRADEIK